MPAYQSYFICTTPRSGSTLLCKLLEATGVSGVPGSHFHEPSIAGWLEYHGLSETQFPDRQKQLRAIVKAAHARGTGGTGLFGLRLQQSSFAFFTRQLAVLHPDAQTDAERIFTAFGPTLFIHLTRPNRPEQAISRLIAEQTGLWHRAVDGSELERTGAPEEPVYDAATITDFIEEATAADNDWNAWFEREEVMPLQINYDDLSDDPVKVLADILETLGVDRSFADGIAPATAKLADATSRAWAERYLAASREATYDWSEKLPYLPDFGYAGQKPLFAADPSTQIWELIKAEVTRDRNKWAQLVIETDDVSFAFWLPEGLEAVLRSQ